MKKHLIHLILFLPLFLIGQTDLPNNTNSVKALVRYQNNKISLRWACSTPTAWAKANTHGFIIERHTVSRNNIRLSQPEKKQINTTPIKPEPLKNWEELVETNNYAAIIAQALYGESFITDGNDDEHSSVLQIVNQATEIEQRFSFSLFAADMDFTAAQKAGWGYIDTDIKPNEEYLYIIKTLVPDDILKIEPGIVLIKTDHIKMLPPPFDLFAAGDDKKINLSWEYNALKNTYTSYHIERSEDAINFKRLGSEPYVNLNDNGATFKKNSYTDTIAQNNKLYHYRIVGISPFGEESTPSKTVSAKGISAQTATPHITDFKLNDNGSVDLYWEFPKEAEENITGFELNRSSKATGIFNVVTQKIPTHQRQINFENLEPSNYFKISAIGKDRSTKASMIKFVQTIDSIAPSAPILLQGTIDTLGIVKLKWKPNTENDILGYRVFRGNSIQEEFAPITVSPILDSEITDTIAVKFLNKNVFYKVVAVDKRFNMSDYSDVLKLKKPDVIPPSAPVIKTYKVTSKGILIEWINSSSDDVKSHQVLRKNKTQNEKDWTTLFSSSKETSFIDKEVINNNQYTYALISEDESGLLSIPSNPITITWATSEKQEVIKQFRSISDRINQQIILSWKKMPSNVSEILLYKNKKGEKPILIKQYPPTIDGFTDSKVNPNSIYEYHLNVLLQDGAPTEIQTIEVIY